MSKIDKNSLKEVLKSYNFVSTFEVSGKKEQIKAKVLNFVSNDLEKNKLLAQQIKQVKVAKIPGQIKEKVFQKLESKNLLERLIGFIQIPQRTIAGASLFLFLFASILNFSFNSVPIYANQQTILEINHGTALIKRNGETLTAKEKMILEVGDVITTEPDSKATIYFPNKSVSRISAKSEIRIREVDINPEKPEENNVEIELTKGRVWNSTKNSNQTGSFNVKTPNSEALVVKKATFDIEVTEEKTVQINSIQNEIIVTLPNNESVKIHQGELAKIGEENQIIKSENIEQSKDQWIADNISIDSKSEGLLSFTNIESISTEYGFNLKNENIDSQKNIESEKNQPTESNELENPNSSTIIENGESTEIISDTEGESEFESIAVLTNSEIFAEESSPISQSPATPDSTIKLKRKAILDLYFEEQE